MDRNKVIKGLEHCFVKRGCIGCPYHRPHEICKIKVGEDALALIREQQEEIQRLCDALKPEPQKEEDE